MFIIHTFSILGGIVNEEGGEGGMRYSESSDAKLIDKIISVG